MRSLGWALHLWNRCHRKKRTFEHKGKTMWRYKEQSQEERPGKEAFLEGINPAEILISDSRLQNYEKTNACCLSPAPSPRYFVITAAANSYVAELDFTLTFIFVLSFWEPSLAVEVQNTRELVVIFHVSPRILNTRHFNMRLWYRVIWHFMLANGLTNAH